MVRGLVLTCFLFFKLSFVCLFSQTDAAMSHFWSDRSYFNPANIVPMFNASVVARTQQIGFNGQPLSSLLNVSTYKPKCRSQFVLILRYDYSG